jgi:hypothetical protein
MPDTFIKPINPNVKERSSTTLTSYFRDSSNAASAPTTAHYRIDDVTSETPITGWTALTPATSIDITIKSSENRMVDNSNERERRVLTVSADKGTDTETRDTFQWYIENIGAFNE